MSQSFYEDGAEPTREQIERFLEHMDSGEEDSDRYGDQVNMGRVTDPLDTLHALSGSYDLVIERA